MHKIQWPTAIVLIMVLIVLTAAYLFGPALGVPAESHTSLVTTLAALGAMLLAATQSIFRNVISHDADSDGVPDALDGTPNLAEKLEGEEPAPEIEAETPVSEKP